MDIDGEDLVSPRRFDFDELWHFHFSARDIPLEVAAPSRRKTAFGCYPRRGDGV
jgi:hypothetical protein